MQSVNYEKGSAETDMINEFEIIEAVKKEIRVLFADDYSGHDYFHSLRVMKNAEMLHKNEGGNLFLIKLASLLHDTDDKKLYPYNVGFENAVCIMNKLELSEDIISAVCDIINCVPFSAGRIPHTIEGEIVQDADRLDALGAIGIARCFAYGGFHKRAFYEISDDTGDLKTDGDSSVAHFYIKLLKLFDSMCTESAKREAARRTEILKDYLNELRYEIIE